MGDFANDLIDGSMGDWRPKKTKDWADMTREEQDSCIGLGFPTVTSESKKPTSKLIYTLEVVDKNMQVQWSEDIEGARGTKHARDLWRIQYPEVRKQFLGGEFQARVKTRRE